MRPSSATLVLVALVVWPTMALAANPCVQHTPMVLAITTPASPGTYTVSGTFPSTPTIGNTVIAMTVAYIGATGFSSINVTDNQATGGNSYHQDVSLNNSTVFGGPSYTQIWSAPVTKASGTFTVTGTFVSTVAQAATFNIVACEANGLAAMPLDRTGTQAITSGVLTVTASAANVQANDFVYTIGFVGGAQNTPTPGYTTIGTDSVSLGTSTGYKSVTSVETSAATYPSSTSGIGAIATYKVATVVAGGARGQLLLLGVGP